MQDFRDLRIWQRSHQLVIEVYQITASFPGHELYGITSQMRWAAASVPTNVAEGCGRGSDADFARFLQIAMGSASELDYHLILAHNLNLLSTSHYERLQNDLVELKRMLNTLISKLRNSC
jgi:four helix bundle protein